MAKNLDAIKKINPEEVKKYRKIVLDYIGEKDSEPAKKQTAPVQGFSFFKKVDGLKLNQAARPKFAVKNAPEKLTPVRDNKISEQNKTNLEKSRREAAEQAKAEEQRKKAKEDELAKQAIAEKLKREAAEKAKAEEAKSWQEKLKLEEKEKAEKRLAEESRRLEKIKRAAEKKRLKAEIKLVKERAAEKQRLKRRQAIKKFKKNLKNKLSENFRVNKKNFVYNLLFLFTFLAMAYIIFCLAILRFNAGGSFIGTLARFLPVPAVVTNQGIISYGDFQAIQDNNYLNLTLTEKKNNLVLWVILKNLRQKYKLPVNSPEPALNIKFIQDEDFNQVGLSRIKKISQLLKSGGEINQLSKYADEFSGAAYYSLASAMEKFGPTVLNLTIGQASEITFRDNGYYIIKRIDDKNSQFGLTYLFVGARTLDQYISEKLNKAKIFILAN